MILNSCKLSILSFKQLIISKKSSILLLGLFFSLLSYGQYTIPEKPSDRKQKFVYDYTSPKLLTKNNQDALNYKLKNYADTTSTQIVIAVINSTKGEDINFLGAQWGHKWGIGQEKEDNGILILLAKNDRKIAISTGYGIEHLLTDATCKLIIENNILPFFKQNNYAGGLNRGVDAIIEVMSGEYKATSKEPKSKSFPFEFIFIVIIIILIIFKNRRGGGKGNKGGGIDLLDILILSSIGRSSSGSSSWGGNSGGGLGGGFGGGGFGGGGASGGW